VLHGEVDEALQRFWIDTRERHRFLQHDPERPILPPAAMFHAGRGVLCPHAAARHAVDARQRAHRLGTPAARPEHRPWRHRTAGHPAAPPRRDARTACCWWPRAKAGAKACSSCCATTRSSVPSVDTLAEFLAGPEKVAIAAAPLAEGFFWHEPAAGIGLQFVTETELFASTPQARRRRKQEQVSTSMR
jgi:transcription-repair coupling factor (superfamily II helicase)